MRTLSGGAIVALTFLATACDRGEFDWDSPQPLGAELYDVDLMFDSSNRLVPRPPEDQPAMPAFTGGRQCMGSVRAARDSATGDWFAAWWSARPDSTADLVVSHSADDGVTWGPALRVDTTDVGQVGCVRPAPAIAVDGPNVHVAYAMVAREGPGVFLTHSMDRGKLFHFPVAVVYGERIGATALAARGNLVAVAYEDPNSRPTRVGVAISRTMGHIFQSRLTTSPPTGAARDPGVVLGDGVIAVTWTYGQGAATNGGVARFVRTGQMR